LSSGGGHGGPAAEPGTGVRCAHARGSAEALNREAASCFGAKTPSKLTGRSGAVRVQSGAARGGETSRRLGARGGLGKARATTGGARRGARMGALSLEPFSVPLFGRVFLKNFQLKCTE
jgi:hypothetical protein